jgi:hypothetical protein
MLSVGVYPFEPDEIVGSANARDVSMSSARHQLDWVDARTASSFPVIVRNGSMLSFSVAVGEDRHGLIVMLPAAALRALSWITVDGNPVAFTGQAIGLSSTRSSGRPQAVIRRPTRRRPPGVEL